MNIRICTYTEAKKLIRQVRNDVFVEEQGVAREEEFDEDDDKCVHAIASNDGLPIATGRLRRDGRIGRIAVVREARGTGIGKRIMCALEKHARDSGIDHLWAHAQVHALGFYERLGYFVSGEVFMEEGIPHRHIEKEIQPKKKN